LQLKEKFGKEAQFVSIETIELISRQAIEDAEQWAKAKGLTKKMILPPAY